MPVRFVLAAALLCASLLPGCAWIRSWGDPEPGDPAPLVEFEPSLKVRKVWSTDVGDGMGKAGLNMGPVFSSGVLYAADHEGRLVAVDAESGRKRWDLDTEQPFSGGPGLDGERIYMGTIDGRVIAYDRSGG
ncbi:MAG: PQQ-binding-like beta-propeller repeat protein, partial [Xanthomonadales bacterium]|nr:PQQ-binding-like beta-propeller repeat protein [Xanthomonadales bacterium]